MPAFSEMTFEQKLNLYSLLLQLLGWIIFGAGALYCNILLRRGSKSEPDLNNSCSRLHDSQSDSNTREKSNDL